MTRMTESAKVASVLLVGGVASRLSGVPIDCAKAMIPLRGRPLGRWLTEWLRTVSDEVIVAASETTRDEFASEFRGDAYVTVVARSPQGTGADFLWAADHTAADHVIVSNGDTISDLFLPDFVESHLRSGAPATIALTRRAGVQNTGAFAVNGDGIIMRSFEDGKGGAPPRIGAAWHAASLGILILSRATIVECRTAAPRSLERDLVPCLVERGQLHAFDAGDIVSLDIGVPERLARLTSEEGPLVKTLHENTAPRYATIVGEAVDAAVVHLSRPHDVWIKRNVDGVDELVSRADVEVERTLREYIAKEIPSVTFVSEELDSDERGLEAGLCAIIDPIDGTKEFVAGGRDFAVSVAIAADRCVVAGVVDAPGRNIRVSASRRGGLTILGARRAETDAPDVVLVSPGQASDPALVALTHSLGLALRPAASLTAKLLGVLMHRAKAAVYLPDRGTARVWDYAAAALAIELDGRTFVSFDGAPILARLPFAHRGGWIAATAEVADAIRREWEAVRVPQ